jgi:hypothetical protein
MPDYADPFSIRLTRRQAQDLSSLSAYDGLSRQELIRRGIDFYLEERRRALLAQANEQAARRVVQPPVAPTGDPPKPQGGTLQVAETPPDGVASDRNRPVKVARR